MLYPFSALLARMKYITRWSLMHSTRAEIYFMRASKALKGYSITIRLLFFTIPAGRLVVKPFFLVRCRAILQGVIKSTSAPVRGERGTLWKSL